MTPPPAPAPAVSLIIPTYNRADRLAATLRAISAQTLPAGALEVIVVDDGPAEATRQVVQCDASAGWRYLTQTRQGATLARNWGAQHAHGGLLVFLDDDIELGPDSLARLTTRLAAHPRTIVVGTLLDPGQAPPSGDAGPVTVSFTECYTGLLSVLAADFAALGGFQDVTGGWPNWDDVEFGYRAHQAGYSLLRDRGAWAIHHDATAQTLAGTARRYQAAGQSAARLFQKYPAIQSHLPMFTDKGPLAWPADGLGLTARKLLRHALSAWPVLRALEWSERTVQRVAPRAALGPALRRWIIGGYIWQGFQRGLRERR